MYAWILRVIDDDIVPQIDADIDVASLKENARRNPHPAWANMNTTITELEVVQA